MVTIKRVSHCCPYWSLGCRVCSSRIYSMRRSGKLILAWICELKTLHILFLRLHNLRCPTDERV